VKEGGGQSPHLRVREFSDLSPAKSFGRLFAKDANKLFLSF